MDSDALAARIGNLLGSSESNSGKGVPSPPPPRVPDHELIARIGQGAYGEVWLARGVTGARRAIKVVWRSNFSSERPYEREFRGIVQFEPLSRSHPGVVNVLHVGRDDTAQFFYYVMELADADGEFEKGGKGAGENLALSPSRPFTPAQYCPRTLATDLKSRTKLPVAEVVSLGVQLAGALGHLHRHGLVHRDVKPSNVIFVQGQAKLADIGLVTGVQQERSYVGTEGYIPPEGQGSERADLFALGRLLYEAATGKNRCDFPGLPDDLDQWPESERKGLLELAEVLARACAPDARQRHANAAELAGDLNLILAGRSVRGAYRLQQQLRRGRVIAVAALVLVFLAVASNSWQRRQSERADARARQETALRVGAQEAQARAEAAERQSQERLYTALLEQARATVLSGEMGQRVRALDAVRRAAAISNSAELRREVFAALALPDLRFERMLPYGDADATCLLDPPFERLALHHRSRRGPVEIRAASDLRLLATLPASTNLPVYVMEWSADGRFLAMKRDYPGGGLKADWEIWELPAGVRPPSGAEAGEHRSTERSNRLDRVEPAGTVGGGAPPGSARRVLLLRDIPHNAVCFHPRLHRILVGQKRAAAIWDLEQGGEVSRFPLPRSPEVVRFSPDGERFAARCPEGAGCMVSVHEVTNASAPSLATHTLAARYASFDWHPGGHWLAVTDHGGNVQRMDALTGETRVLGRHKAPARMPEFSPDGDYLVTGGWEREIICWDARTLQRAFTIRLNGQVAQFRADGRALAIQTRSGLQLHTFERPGGYREFAEDLGARLQKAAFSSDGRWLAASADGRIGVWDLTQDGPAALDGRGQRVDCFFTADGSELFASRSRDGAAVCFRWRITPATNADGPPRLERLPLSKPAGFTSLALNSNLVVMTGANGTQLLARDEVETGKADWTPTVAGINGLSPDGRWLGIVRLFSASLYVHRLPGLDRVAKLTQLPQLGMIHSFRFSPSGDAVALSSERGVELWNTATWERTHALTNFTEPVLFAPDGRSLWLTKDLHTAGLYDARTLEPRLLLPTGMLPLAVSPDGRRLAVSVDMRRLQVWDLAALREQFRALGLDWGSDP